MALAGLVRLHAHRGTGDSSQSALNSKGATGRINRPAPNVCMFVARQGSDDELSISCHCPPLSLFIVLVRDGAELDEINATGCYVYTNTYAYW